LLSLLIIHSSSNQNERRLTAQTHVLVHRAQALANQGGCHLFWNETLLALRFDASPRPRFGCVELIGDCLQRFPFAPRMRTGAWMLDTFMRIAPMQILLDRGLSQAGVLDRGLSHATWASYWSNGALWTRQRSTRDSASLHPCRQAAYFLPCTRPPDITRLRLRRPTRRPGPSERYARSVFTLTRLLPRAADQEGTSSFCFFRCFLVMLSILW
jgi:hypothetical protein